MPSRRHTRKVAPAVPIERETEQPPYRFPAKPIEATTLVARQPPWVFLSDTSSSPNAVSVEPDEIR